MIFKYENKNIVFDTAVSGSMDEDSGCESIYFKRPKRLKKLRDYQDCAIDAWVCNGYRGLYNMATGTGKTITALCSLERLYNDLGNGIFTIILCPQRHIIDQWVDNIRDFGVNPIIGYSGSEMRDWKNRLKNAKMKFNNNQTNECFITTNNSFSSSAVQRILRDLRGPCVIVVDEVHNMGSEKRFESLIDTIEYRLGLSATIDRFEDPGGTDKIRSYFGKECIAYTLEEAIKQGMLCQYRYYPVLCTMTEPEYEKFIHINWKIDEIGNDPTISKREKEKQIRELKIGGYNLISSMHNKYENLVSLCSDRLNDTHMLIYCGKARWIDDVQDADSQNEGKRLVEKTTELLGKTKNGLGMKLSKFTYEESPQERRAIKDDFEKGYINAMIAMSCLDEGVDIPSVRTAIITSSSNNPKESIQRRGRVLRLHDGKDFAEIYDMVAIPRQASDVSGSPESNVIDLKLLAREFRRVIEFSNASSNKGDSEEIVDRILHTTTYPGTSWRRIGRNPMSDFEIDEIKLERMWERILKIEEDFSNRNVSFKKLQISLENVSKRNTINVTERDHSEKF